MLSDREKQEILRQLIIDNQDLNNLESTLAEFNIFEAIGVIRQEIKHSNFLSFLLNPGATHKLGDLFLKKLLICALLDSDDPPLNPIEIDIADLEDVEIRREWRNIDILIYSANNHFVCAIENKIDASEHSNQLKRYKEIISIEFPKCKQVFLYLTKEGDSASDEKWLSFSYERVAEVMESIYHQYQSTIGREVYTLMSHYVSLIRRHIVSDSEISKLCQKIYKQHRQALDLIYEHRPDLQLEIFEFIQQFIGDNQQANIAADDSSKKYIRFAPREWDNLAFQKTGDHWTSSNRILLFEFINEPQYLGLHLTIGPSAEKLKQDISQTIKELEIAGFADQCQLKSGGWSHIYKQKILDKSDYLDENWDSLQAKIEIFWHKHLDREIRLIRQAISNLQHNPIV